MKKHIYLLLATTVLTAAFASRAKAQSQELQQLILNVTKWTELKDILDNMRKGYDVLTTGYNTVKDLSEGNFNLHKLFLDGLLQVSPTVAKYHKIVDIITNQKTIITEYKSAYSSFVASGVFSANDLNHISQVYSNLLDKSAKNIEELTMVITAGQLRMNDAERIAAIDRIDKDVKEKLDFMYFFNNKTTLLQQQQQKALKDLQTLQQLN